MSGGHFDGLQYRVSGAADEIRRLIEGSEYSQYNFSDETVAKFKEAVNTLVRSAIMIRRIDWLVSGDDGEENFHEKWEKELCS